MIKSHNLVIYLLFFLLLSCEKSTGVEPELILAKDQLAFTKSSGKATLAIKANLDWSITSSQTWCTVTPSSGSAGTQQLSVAVTENTSGAAREAILTVAVGTLSKQVKVSQEYQNLAISTKAFDLSSDGGDITVDVQSTSTLTITIQNSWIKLKSESNATKIYSVDKNILLQDRIGKIYFESAGIKDSITINQKGLSFAIPADANGMASTATVLAGKIKIGINIGNTLEATGGESGWGNPMITNDLIKAMKLNGFNAIRLPCAWNQYANQTTLQINPTWLARVKEVVQYCVSNDMYVIVNIHWDGGWLENNCTEAKKIENNMKQKAFWEQISIALRDFDEHVLFASANEPNASDATQMAVLLSYHQTFINAVRSTGGKNAYRVLVVQGPNTDIEKTNSLMKSLPTDAVANRMMAEVHYYTPWNFCGMTKDETWGNQFYYWGAPNHSTTDTAHNPTWGEESTVDTNMALMKQQFVDKGIPVIIGEFGATKRTNLTGDALRLHLASRAYYFKYVTKTAKANGCLPFFWDTGDLINRSSYAVGDQQSLDGLIQGAQ